MSEIDQLEGVAPRGEMRWCEPMSRHVSWRAGGAAARAYRPADLADLVSFVAMLPPAEPVCMVGLGSNLLVRDGGFAGTVIFTHGVLSRIDMQSDGTVRAEAGVASPKVARFTALHQLRGGEFLAGVPGTVGGALAMNAGCYGGETWAVVQKVLTLDRSGVLHERDPSQYLIGYRSVALREAREEWFVAAWFRFAPGEREASRRIIREFLQRRIASQPLQQPNAGSVFRNPAGDHAARLIEAAGLKGFRLGGAEISGKHANFIVNTGGATASDIEQLIALARTRVLERFGVALEQEVRVIGDRLPAGTRA